MTIMVLEQRLGASLRGLGLEDFERADIVRSWLSYQPGLFIGGSGAGPAIKALQERNVEAPLAAVRELSADDSSHVANLYRIFRIRNFGEYAAQTLSSQLDLFRAADPGLDRRVSLVISGAENYGEHVRGGTERAFGPVAPVYTEADSASEISRAISLTSGKLGRIDNLILFAHGNKNGLAMRTYSGVVTSEDMRKPKALPGLITKKAITPAGKIVVASCESGVPGGFAQTLSSLSGFTVIAADKKVHCYLEADPDQPSGARVRMMYREGARNGDAVTYGLALGLLKAAGVENPMRFLNLDKLKSEDATVVYERGELAEEASHWLAV